MKTKDKNYEEDLLASFDQGEWQSVHDLKDEIARYATVATASFNKDKRINIRFHQEILKIFRYVLQQKVCPIKH